MRAVGIYYKKLQRGGKKITKFKFIYYLNLHNLTHLLLSARRFQSPNALLSAILYQSLNKLLTHNMFHSNPMSLSD